MFLKTWKLLSTKFLEECKYIEKENKVTRYITDDLGISCDDSEESFKKKENLCVQKLF